MSNLFKDIAGQDQVCGLLQGLIEQDRVSHAYLFYGPEGSGKKDAAYAFAQGIVCKHGGCRQADCLDCTRSATHAHPDIHVIEPEGAKGYLIEQIRSLVSDTNLSPVQSHKKVYIIDSAHLMNAASANAFLKTLEEPPASVVHILLSTQKDAVLPTILSRCQLVSFRSIPEQEALPLIMQKTGAAHDNARVAYAVATGSIARACEFIESTSQQEVYDRIMAAATRLHRLDVVEVLRFSLSLTEGIEESLESLKQEQEEQCVAAEDFLSHSAFKALQERHKRALSAKTLDLYRLRCAILSTYMRDIMLCKCENADKIVNISYKTSIEEQANITKEANILRAFDALENCQRAIGYNVNPKLCFDTLLLKLREELYDPDITG